MKLSAKEAAELVGMSKTGMIKAMRDGRVSAEKDINGEWRVDPVELERVYPWVSKRKPDEPQDTAPDARVLAAENEQLRQRLADKDREIDNLWRRFDAEAQERQKLTMILTDKQMVEPQPQPQPQPRSWWERLFGT